MSLNVRIVALDTAAGRVVVTDRRCGQHCRRDQWLVATSGAASRIVFVSPSVHIFLLAPRGQERSAAVDVAIVASGPSLGTGRRTADHTDSGPAVPALCWEGGEPTMSCG